MGLPEAPTAGRSLPKFFWKTADPAQPSTSDATTSEHDASHCAAARGGVGARLASEEEGKGDAGDDMPELVSSSDDGALWNGEAPEGARGWPEPAEVFWRTAFPARPSTSEATSSEHIFGFYLRKRLSYHQALRRWSPRETPRPWRSSRCLTLPGP